MAAADENLRPTTPIGEQQWGLRLQRHISGLLHIPRGWNIWAGIKPIHWWVLSSNTPLFLWEEVTCMRSTQNTRLLISSQHWKSWPSIRGLSKTGLWMSQTTDRISFMSCGRHGYFMQVRKKEHTIFCHDHLWGPDLNATSLYSAYDLFSLVIPVN